MPKKPAVRVLLLGFFAMISYYCIQKSILFDPKEISVAYYVSAQIKRKSAPNGYDSHRDGKSAHLAPAPFSSPRTEPKATPVREQYSKETKNNSVETAHDKQTDWTSTQRQPASLSSPGPATITAHERERYIVDTAGCKIPNFNLFDKSILKYLKRVGRYKCRGKHSLIRLVNGSTPVIDEASLLKTFEYEPKSVRCTYAEIFRNESILDPDHSFFLKPEVALNFGQPLTAEYVQVHCYHGKKMFHQEFLLLPLLKKDVEERCEKARKDSEDKGSGLNVLILGLDSTSRLNFNRHFKATGRYVRNFLKSYELMGYNKVGSNSFPNLTPLLTGLSESEAISLTGGEFFDSLVFLWKLYAKKGYRTVFHEEQTKWGLHSHKKNGLKRAPTDYYTHHADMAVDMSGLKKLNCPGARLSLELYLDYMHGLLKTFDTRPFFAYIWLSEIVHDNQNMAAHCDAPFKNALVKLHDSGILNNTVLAFISDHGNRISLLRRTYIGRFEDCLPFAFLVFPPWFLRQHPDFAVSLEVNQRRLSTHYDMHATLLQLLDSRLPKTVTRHGQSLFYMLPEVRTCADASIPIQFCTCVETEVFPLTHPLTMTVARFLIARLNAVVKKQFKRKCKPWALKSVLRIQLYLYSNRSIASTSDKRHTTDRYYWIQISATPNDALFEATVKHSFNSTTSRFSIVQQADRLDWYSSHSKCVRGHRWEMYCHCKK